MITLGQTAYQPSTRMPPTSGRWAGWDWNGLYQATLTAIQYPVSALNYSRALDYITNLPKIMVFNYPILLAAWVRFTKLYPTHNHAAALRYMEALLRQTGKFQDTADKAKWWMIEQEWQSLEAAAPQVRGLSGFPFVSAGEKPALGQMPEPQPPPMQAGIGETLPYLPERYPGRIILPVIIPPPPSLYPGPPTQLRKSGKWLAWAWLLGLVLLHKEASPLSLLSGTRVKKNRLGYPDRLSRLSDPSPMMSKDWIASQIQKAVEEDPGRRVHGDTRYNAFFITPEREIVPFDMINTLEGTTPAMDTISVHSHSANNWRQFIKRTGNLEPFNPLNDMDVRAFQQMVLRGIANTDVLIMADGRMEVLHVPPESEKNFISLQPPEFKILRPTYDYYASVYRRTGKKSHEVDKQLLREFAGRYNLLYYDANWLPPEPEPFVKERPSGTKKTFTAKPIKKTKTKAYYLSPFFVEPEVYPGIPEQMEIWRERPPVQQRLLGRDSK